LDRLTGQQVTITVPSNHQLNISLPAGTGRLFKYNEGDFLVSAVPEPATSSLGILCYFTFASIARRRKRSF
jgi:hypothetical protein